MLHSPVSQPVLVGELFHSVDRFCCPPLDMLQQPHVSPALKTPRAVLPVSFHQCRADGQVLLPRLAGHTSCNAAQGTVGFLG